MSSTRSVVRAVVTAVRTLSPPIVMNAMLEMGAQLAVMGEGEGR